MLRMLSTRLLTPKQLAMFAENQILLKQYEAVTVTSTLEPNSWVAAALHVFTSGNAVRACFPEKGGNYPPLDCCCVGGKTAVSLEQLGHRVLEQAISASELVQQLIEKYAKRYIYFYSGNRSLRVIPNQLLAAGLHFKEIEVYRTELNSNPFAQDFDIVLFFSPSGVESYFTNSNACKPIAICIGETTANAAKKHTEKYIIAATTTVEDVLTAAVILIKDYEYNA